MINKNGFIIELLKKPTSKHSMYRVVVREKGESEREGLSGMFRGRA